MNDPQGAMPNKPRDLWRDLRPVIRINPSQFQVMSEFYNPKQLVVDSKFNDPNYWEVIGRENI